MLTRFLAVYGAVIGSAALAWNVFIAVRDRARLKIFAGPDDPARKDVRPSHDTDPRFLVHVQNRGRRSIAVERIWYTRRSMPGVKYLLTDRFDMGTEHLGEGESLTHEISLSTVSPDDLDRVVVEAQDGRSWSGRYDKKAKPAWWNA